jgi:hypothetical protein
MIPFGRPWPGRGLQSNTQQEHGRPHVYALRLMQYSYGLTRIRDAPAGTFEPWAEPLSFPVCRIECGERGTEHGNALKSHGDRINPSVVRTILWKVVMPNCGSACGGCYLSPVSWLVCGAVLTTRPNGTGVAARSGMCVMAAGLSRLLVGTWAASGRSTAEADGSTHRC